MLKMNSIIKDVNVTRYVHVNNRHICALYLTVLQREIQKHSPFNRLTCISSVPFTVCNLTGKWWFVDVF